MQIYPVVGDWRECLKLVEKIDKHVLECFMPHYTGFKPNSYVYTKALAEQICESYKNQIPITIVRPSIVVGTEAEPIEGWNDNFNGPGKIGICATVDMSPLKLFLFFSFSWTFNSLRSWYNAHDVCIS